MEDKKDKDSKEGCNCKECDCQECDSLGIELEKEKEELSVEANKRLLMHLIDVIDDINRAKEGKKNEEGFEMIFNKLKSVLQDYGITELECKKGDEFDPKVMEAVTFIHCEDKNKRNKVADIIGKGYMNINTKVVFKSIKVIVYK